MTAWAGPASGSGPRGAAPQRFRISVSHSAHGGILPAHPAPVAAGDDFGLAIFPHAGYHLDSLLVDGLPVRKTSFLVLEGVRAPHTVVARFAPDDYVIIATAGPHASITPNGVVPVTYSRSQSFFFAADSGFKVCELLVDGKALHAGSRYTFTNVRAEHHIVVRTEHHASTVIAPEPGELWLAGESREIRWQPLEREFADSAEVRVSYHGTDGPWEPIWRGLFRSGSAEWRVPALDCDSVSLCVATIDSDAAPGLDYSSGLVRVRQAPGNDLRFFVRASPSPATVGPIRLEFAVPVDGDAALEIYTVTGREVWRLPLGFAAAGRRSAMWDGRLAGGEPAKPGVYFARLSTRAGDRNCRLVLVP